MQVFNYPFEFKIVFIPDWHVLNKALAPFEGELSVFWGEKLFILDWSESDMNPFFQLFNRLRTIYD